MLSKMQFHFWFRMSKIFTDYELQLTIRTVLIWGFFKRVLIRQISEVETKEKRVDWALTLNGLESKQNSSFLVNVHHQPFYSTTEQPNIQSIQNQFRQTNTPKNSSFHELFQGKNFWLFTFFSSNRNSQQPTSTEPVLFDEKRLRIDLFMGELI